MYALRIAYQRHKNLLRHFGAGSALFIATLVVTMPMPSGQAEPELRPSVQAAEGFTVTRAGALTPLLSSRPMDEATGLAFVPATGPL